MQLRCCGRNNPPVRCVSQRRAFPVGDGPASRFNNAGQWQEIERLEVIVHHGINLTRRDKRVGITIIAKPPGMTNAKKTRQHIGLMLNKMFTLIDG